MDEVELTDHAMERMLRRVGCKPSTAHILAKRALEYGISRADAKGPLREYLKQISLGNDPPTLRVTNKHVYIFRGNLLVTVYYLPKRLL